MLSVRVSIIEVSENKLTGTASFFQTIQAR